METLLQIKNIPIPYIVLSLFTLFLLVKLNLVQRDNKLLANQLTRTTVTLEFSRKKFAELQQQHDEVKEFQKSINEAEITTRFQKPRLMAKQTEPQPTQSSNAPEKYSYIRNLTEKGMSVKEIASLLSISTHEAQQLVALTRLSPAA